MRYSGRLSPMAMMKEQRYLDKAFRDRKQRIEGTKQV
jgi:hypothetical protein